MFDIRDVLNTSSCYKTERDFPVFMQLSNHLFEELAMDVYDEVDRRETDGGKGRKAWKWFCLPSE